MSSFATRDDVETLQRESFNYFVREANRANGLIRGKTEGIRPKRVGPGQFAALNGAPLSGSAELP